eukprot:scaffold99409_cov19-Tisochrysis_lutea.AAC.1
MDAEGGTTFLTWTFGGLGALRSPVHVIAGAVNGSEVEVNLLHRFLQSPRQVTEQGTPRCSRVMPALACVPVPLIAFF